MASTFTTVGDGTRVTFQLPIAVQAPTDVTSVLVNGSAGPAVSGVAGELVTLASAPAAGAAVAITVKDRRNDASPTLLPHPTRPVLTSYTAATHTLVGTAEPNFVVDVYVGNAWATATQAAADGSFSAVLPSFSGTQNVTAQQRKAPIGHTFDAANDGYGISTSY